MSSNNGSKGGSSIGFFGLLQIAFIVLKLCKVITWSWWLVFIPIYVEIGLIATLIALVFARNGVSFKELWEYLFGKKDKK